MRQDRPKVVPPGPRESAQFTARGPDPPALGYINGDAGPHSRGSAAGEGSRRGDAVEVEVTPHERQMAGIAALVDLANNVAAISHTGELRAVAQEQPGSRANAPNFIVALVRRLREDHLMRNSLYLVLNSGLQSAFGFGFWIISAHLFSADNVGKASALISATNVIAYLALLGLNTGFGHFLPTARNRDSLITSGLLTVAVCGAVIALGYSYLTPFLAPRLAFVAQHPALTFGFAVMTATAALNVLTDSVFVTARRAGYTAFVDGIVAGVGKVVLAIILAGTSAYGLFLATAAGTALAALSSLGFIYTIMHTRLSLKRPLGTLKPLLRFSSANYVGNVLNMLPTLVVPVIVLDRLGASSAAYYFVVFQVVGILYAAALAIEQTFLAEGSHADANMRRLRRRSLRILLMLCLPAAAGLVAVGRWLLLAFGWGYYHYGWDSFLLLAAAAGPIAAIYWCLTVLRLAGRLRAIINVNATYAISVCALAWFGSAHGLTALAAAWPVGALIAATVAAASIPRETYARHRRSGKVATPRDNASRIPRAKPSTPHRRQRPNSLRQKMKDLISD